MADRSDQFPLNRRVQSVAAGAPRPPAVDRQFVALFMFKAAIAFAGLILFASRPRLSEPVFAAIGGGLIFAFFAATLAFIHRRLSKSGIALGGRFEIYAFLGIAALSGPSIAFFYIPKLEFVGNAFVVSIGLLTLVRLGMHLWKGVRWLARALKPG